MSQHKKILILAENLDIQITSSSRRTSKIAIALSNHYEISILYPSIYTSDFKWLPNIEMIALSPFPEAKGGSFGFKDKVNSRLTGFSFKEHNIIDIWAKGIQQALQEQSFTAILPLASGVDYYTHHALLKVDTQIPILAYYHDPYPWIYYPETYRHTNAKIIQKKKAASLAKVLNKATANLFPSKKLAELFQENYSFSDDSIVIAPHLIQELPDIYFWESGRAIDINSTDFNITYAGALHPSRKVETLVDAFIMFVEKVDGSDQVFLNFIGPAGAYKDHIETKAKAYPKHIRYVGRVGYDQSLEYLKNSQINVIIEADDTSSPFLPGKFPDYVAVNRQIVHIGPEDAEVRRLLGKDYPYAVKHGNINALSAMFSKLYKQFKDTGELRLDREDLSEYLGSRAFVEKVINLLADR